jgi:hypothetical protein
MLNNDWNQIEGFTNMGEDVDDIFAKKVGDTVCVAYYAFGGLKVLELSGVDDAGTFNNTEADFSTVISECGDDWEIAIPVVCGANSVIVVVDDMGDTTAVPFGTGEVVDVKVPIVEASSEYDVDELGELDDELLAAFHLI